jgi:hypothetical protein
MTLALNDVGAVHARRVHANQDAPRPRDRRNDFAGLGHFGATDAVEDNCFRRAPFSGLRRDARAPVVEAP